MKKPLRCERSFAYACEAVRGALDLRAIKVTMKVIQDPRITLATMVYAKVFERFPRLRVTTIEAASGCIGRTFRLMKERRPRGCVSLHRGACFLYSSGSI